MTLPTSSRVSDLYTTNGTQKDFSFGFRVFYDPENGGYGLEVRRQTETGYEVIPKSQYDVIPSSDSSSGIIRFYTPPESGMDIYIAGFTEATQQLDLTNYGRYSAESIETQFDYITAIIQEWLSSLGEETRQRIASDEKLTQYVVQRINEFVQQVNQNWDDKAQEIEDYIATIMPSFTQTLRDEIEAFAVAGMQDAIDQTLADSKSEIDDAVARANAAALAAAITGKVYDTPDAGVDPVTGVQNGAYYNVRSPSDDSFLIEYQNVGGIPTPSGKSYPSAAYVQNVAKHTALPFVDGKTYSLNERVQLDNGDIVKSTVANNTVDPNVDMAGWRPSVFNVVVNSVSDLTAIKAKDGEYFNVLSRDAPNYALEKPFSGGGLFVYDADSTAAANGGTVFDAAQGGKFLRVFQDNVCVSWFAGHGWTGEDKTARVQQAINFTNKIENALALKVDGKYTLTSSLIIDRMVDTTKGDYLIYAEGNNDGFRINTPITMFSSSIPSDFPAAGYTRHPVSEFVTFKGLDFEATVQHIDNCVFDDKFLRITFDGCTHRKIRGCKSAQYLQSITYTGVNKFRQHAGYFIDVASAYDLRCNGMQFENSADGFRFTGNVFGGYFDKNLFQGSGQFLRVNAMAGGSISKNYFEANADQEIIFTGAGNGTIINGNLFYTAPDLASDPNFYHIQLGGSFGVSLQGNRALHNLADNSNSRVFTISESGNRVEANRKVLKVDINSIAQVTPTTSGTQVSSLPIKNLNNVIYTDVTGGGLLLPKLSEMGSNTQITVINKSNTAVNIFPNDGERILGGGYNAAHPLNGFDNSVTFYKSDSDYWIDV